MSEPSREEPEGARVGGTGAGAGDDPVDVSADDGASSDVPPTGLSPITVPPVDAPPADTTPTDSSPGGGEDADPAAPLPDVLDGEPRTLDPRWPDSERVGWRIFAWIAFPVAAGAVAFWWRPTGWPIAGLVAAPLLGATLVVRLGMRYTRAAFRRTSWHATEQVLEIRRGVWWRSVVTIPRVRVQHTDVRQGPVQRRFGLATLVVHTAGTEHATVTLEGMSRPEALAVRDHLLREQADDAV